MKIIQKNFQFSIFHSQLLRGFGLVETVVALAVFIILASGSAAFLVPSLRMNRLSGNIVDATLYAQEGIEAARSIKYQGWMTPFLAVSCGSGCGIATGSGYWAWNGTNNIKDPYIRSITITDVLRDGSGNVVTSGGTSDPNTKKVTSTVSWNFTAARPETISLVTYLTNWIAQISGKRGMQIAYYDATNHALKYAMCTTNCTVTSNWSTVIVDYVNGKDTGRYTSLALYNGNPRISYYDVSNHDLRYATCDTNCTSAVNWTKITIDSSSTDVGLYTSLKFTLNGNPRVSYYDSKNGDLKYAFCDINCTILSNWTTITLDSVGDVGQYTSLVLNSADNPRISYYNVGSKDLWYISCDANCNLPASWTKVLVDAVSNDTGRYASLALNSSGNPSISSYDATNHDLRFATCATNCTIAANWTNLTIDTSSNDIGQYSSLSFDGTMPRITYYDNQNKVLKYASCDANCTTANNWTKITTDNLGGGTVGQYSFLVIDSGQSTISYYDVTNKDLKQAVCNSSCTIPSNWIKTIIDSVGDVGQFNSM